MRVKNPEKTLAQKRRPRRRRARARPGRAGTNFLIRAAAFKEAGWSPEYTLTEDFALGMELKKRRWQCRYVEEYLAVGEAPDEVRNCFQQRSRWAKGVRAPWVGCRV